MEKLQGDVPVQRHIVRAIHDAHSTGPDGFDDLVAAECLADHDRKFTMSTTLRYRLIPIPDP